MSCKLGLVANPMSMAAIAAGLLAAQGAHAGVIYDNGGPNQISGTFADGATPITTAVDEFTLSAGSNTIGSVNWWGFCYPGPACGKPNSFTLYIYSNSNGTPGTVLDSYSVGNANQTATGQVVSNADEYFYSATIDLTLTAGTQYWLGISDVSVTPAWAWEHSSESGDSYSYQSGWVSNPVEQAFNLTSPAATGVPEPGTLAMFGAGALGLAAMRWRRKTKA